MKMFANVNFQGLAGASNRDWRIFSGTVRELGEMLKEASADQESHHVDLALELLGACLQRDSDDRCVSENENIITHEAFWRAEILFCLRLVGRSYCCL